MEDGTLTVRVAELPADTGLALKLKAILEVDVLADNVTASL